MSPKQALTLSSNMLMQSSSSQGMSRRHHGTKTALSSAQNNQRRSWMQAMGKGNTPMDDLTTMSSTRADMQESSASNTIFPQSPPSAPLEISPGNTMHGPAKKSSLAFRILEQPNLKMGRFLVLLAASIYGTNFSIVKLLDDTMPLSVSAALRFGLAAAVVSAIVLSREADDVDPMVKKERNMAFWGGVEIGLWYCIGYIAQAEGLQTVAAGKSAFFNALAVVVVPILDVLFKSKILKKTDIASVLIACLGVGLLELGPEGGLTISSGDVLAFMQTIFFGVGYWRLESESHQHSNNAGRLTSGQLSAVAFGSLIYAATECGFGHLELTSTSQIMDWFSDPFIIGSLVWAGLISTALALYLETVALKIVSATELTLLMTTTSLWGAAFAFVTLGEVLNPTGMIGGLLIMGGCILGNLTPPEGKPTGDPMLPVTNNSDSLYDDMLASLSASMETSPSPASKGKHKVDATYPE